jgi:hypothetical protein
MNKWKKMKNKKYHTVEQLQNLAHIYMTAHFPCLAQAFQYIVLELSYFYMSTPPILVK